MSFILNSKFWLSLLKTGQLLIEFFFCWGCSFIQFFLDVINILIPKHDIKAKFIWEDGKVENSFCVHTLGFEINNMTGLRDKEKRLLDGCQKVFSVIVQ